MPGQRPKLRHIAKGEQQDSWTEIGASWELASGSLSTRIDLAAAEPFVHEGVLRFLTVENKPREPKPANEPAPTRSATRTRRSNGPQPAA